MTSGPSVATQTRNSDSGFIMWRAHATTIPPPHRGCDARSAKASQTFDKMLQTIDVGDQFDVHGEGSV